VHVVLIYIISTFSKPKIENAMPDQSIDKCKGTVLVVVELTPWSKSGEPCHMQGDRGFNGLGSARRTR
jgi:hypothetical protein